MCLIFNPGPTKVHPEIQSWLGQAIKEKVFSRHHRSPWFRALFSDVELKLRKIGQLNDSYKLFIFGCASEIWERSLESLVLEKAFMLTTGEFGNRWLSCAEALKIPVYSYCSDLNFSGSVTDLVQKKKVDTICLVHGETSIGQDIPSEELEKLRYNNPNQIIILDAVSTFPVKEFNYNLIDVIIFSIQKCFALPSGMGVALVNERAISRAVQVFKEKKRPLSGFASFKVEYDYSLHSMTPATPNVTALWMLNKVLDKYLNHGLAKIRYQTKARANFVRTRLLELGFKNLIPHPDWRSLTVLTFYHKNGLKIRERLELLGIQVGGGFGNLASFVLRIANFPSYTFKDFEKLCGALSTMLERKVKAA